MPWVRRIRRHLCLPTCLAFAFCAQTCGAVPLCTFTRLHFTTPTQLPPASLPPHTTPHPLPAFACGCTISHPPQRGEEWRLPSQHAWCGRSLPSPFQKHLHLVYLHGGWISQPSKEAAHVSMGLGLSTAHFACLPAPLQLPPCPSLMHTFASVLSSVSFCTSYVCLILPEGREQNGNMASSVRAT